MAVFRVEKIKDYTIMSNHHLRNVDLSLKAKGLMSLMLSLPEDWDYTLKGLACICRDGVDSISRTIKELEDHGYLTRRRFRYPNGRLGDIEYTIHEQPESKSVEPELPKPESPKRENPVQVNSTQEIPTQAEPMLEKPAQLNTKQSKTKKSNTKEIKDKIDKIVCSLNVFAAPVEETAAPAPTAPVATQSTQPTEPAAPTLPSGAFTPDGQGSVLDYVENETDEKLFYTITTKSGNVFYLVVDEARGEQNVYFLNAVTESDLTALAEENNKISVSGISASQTCTCTDKCNSGKVNEDCPVCKNDVSKCEGKAASTADEPEGGKSEKDGGNITMYVIIGAAFIAVAGVGIYVKVIRPKKQQPEFDDDEGDDYGEYDGADDYGEPEYLPDDDDTDES